MPPLIRVLFVPAMLSLGAHAIFTGKLIGRWGWPIAKEARPVAFWLGVSGYLVICIFLLVTRLR
jgi:hypothetical protein